MSTIANAKVEHNYNRYNGYFFGCLHLIYFRNFTKQNFGYSKASDKVHI